MENNKLIAEFMGINPILYEYYYYDRVKEIDKLIYYNSDWNLLMKVVDKIEEMGCRTELLGQKDNYNFQIGKKGGHYRDFDSDGETKILAVYSGVVQFIEWFNAAKKVKKIIIKQL